MKRRALLRAGGALAATGGLTGCLGIGLFETRAIGVPPIPEDRPDGIYIPSHVEGMEMSGTATTGDYAFGLMYSYPHRFWNVNGDSVSLTDIEDADDVHLMASVWDPQTKTVLPNTGLTSEIYRDSTLVSQEAIYPMLSQPMGFHYGANFQLSGDGTYRVKLSVGAMPTRRSGAFVGRFSEPTTVDIEIEYSEQAKNEIMFKRMKDRTATPGAIDPMAMERIPNSLAPTQSALPGQLIGSAMSNDAELVATRLGEPPDGIDGNGPYIAVSARSRYNRMIIPAMALEGTLTRDGETVYAGEFTRTLDPKLHYHYGTTLDDIQSGDTLELSVAVQPQTARHEGYETAFGGLLGGMSDVRITV